MKVVLDTNVLVAAGFDKGSASARIVNGIRDGRYILTWDTATQAETRLVLRQIPPLAWEDFSDLYRPEHRSSETVHPEDMHAVSDPADRKFAALAAATGAILVTNDDHLLAARESIGVQVLRPTEFVRRCPEHET